MDQIRDFQLKIMMKSNEKPSVRSSIVAKEMENLCPKIRQFYPHFEDMAIFFASIAPSIEPDVVKLAYCALFGIWICLFEDKIENQGQLAATQLLQVINEERAPSEAIHEMMWSEVMKGFFVGTDDKRAQALKDTIDLIESMANEHQIDFNTITLPEFVQFRRTNCSSKYFIFCIEFGVGTQLAVEGKHSDVMKRLAYDLVSWLNLAQDMLGLKKEVLDNDPANYISIKMRDSSLNFDQCIAKLIEDLDQMERQINEHVNILFGSGEGKGVLRETIANFMQMFIKFHNYSKRFNPE